MSHRKGELLKKLDLRGPLEIDIFCCISHTSTLLRSLSVAEGRRPAKPSTLRTFSITATVYNLGVAS